MTPVFQWSEWFHMVEYNWLNMDLIHVGIEHEPCIRPGDWEFTFRILGLGFVLNTWRNEPPGPTLKRAMELRDEFYASQEPEGGD